jgi:hypothetical protein
MVMNCNTLLEVFFKELEDAQLVALLADTTESIKLLNLVKLNMKT